MIKEQTIFELVQFPDYPLVTGKAMADARSDAVETSNSIDLGLHEGQTVTFRLCNYIKPNKLSFYVCTQAGGVQALKSLCFPDYKLLLIEEDAIRTKLGDLGSPIEVYELHRTLVPQLCSKKVSLSKGIPKPVSRGINWERITKIMRQLKGPAQLQLKVGRYSHEEMFAQQLQSMRFILAKEGVNQNVDAALFELINSNLYAVNLHVFATHKDDGALLAGNLAGESFTVSRVQADWELQADLLNGSCHYAEHHRDDIPAMVENISYLYTRKDVDRLFQLPYACSDLHINLYDLSVVQVNPFTHEGNEGSVDPYSIALGMYRSGAAYSLPVFELLKHGVVFGKTGFGKTVTTMSILKQMASMKVPFLLIESAKTEYHNALCHLFKPGELKVYNFKNPYGTDFFRINPLIPLRNITIAQHISTIKGCFMAAIPMAGATPYVFEAMLYDFYKWVACEGDESRMFDPNYVNSLKEQMRQQLTINNLYCYVDVYLQSHPNDFADSNDNDFAPVLKRRLSRLSQNSVVSHAFAQANDGWDVAELFNRPTLIELDELSDDSDKALIMSVVLAYLDEYRKQSPQLVDVLREESFNPAKHVNFLFIEEAHRLLSAKGQHSGGEGETENGKQKFISQFCDLLAEVRARGTGLFLVEQSPSALVTEVIRHCNLNITHRLTEQADRNILGSNMNMTAEQKQYLSVLGIGSAVVYEGGLDKPVFLHIYAYEPTNEKN